MRNGPLVLFQLPESDIAIQKKKLLIKKKFFYIFTLIDIILLCCLYFGLFNYVPFLRNIYPLVSSQQRNGTQFTFMTPILLLFKVCIDFIGCKKIKIELITFLLFNFLIFRFWCKKWQNTLSNLISCNFNCRYDC